MDLEITSDSILRMLAAQGVACDATRAQGYATALAQMLKGAAPGTAQLAFEEEPAGYLAEQRRNAP